MFKKYLKTLEVDLDNKKSDIIMKKVSDVSLEEKMGGMGKSFHDLQKHIFQNSDLTDAYDPRNLLSFNIGFLTGSKVMTGLRTYVSALSPLKTSKSGSNGVYFSAASGQLGSQIRSLDFDSINITGKLDKPSYLVLDENGLTIKDASELIGKTTDQKIKILSKNYDKSGFAVIGPAGENLVRYAAIAFSTGDQLRNNTNHMRFAGRGGMGAVMGSKNILGIVIKGTGKKQDAGNVVSINKEIATGKLTSKYRETGTYCGNMKKLDGLGVGVHDNFSKGKDERLTNILRETLMEKGYSGKNKGCTGCAIKCWKEIHSPDGKILGKLDYEPGSLLGPNLGIYKIDDILELINLADELGLDSMSAGVCIGFEMQKQDKFGDIEFAKDLIKQIANKEHGLSEGVARYAPNDLNAMHVKGLELAAYLGNLNPAYAVVVAGPHTSMTTYNNAWYAGPETDNSVKEWVGNTVRGVKALLYDMNGLCKFSKVDFEDVINLYENVYDEKITIDDVKNLGMKVYLIGREIDKQLGFTSEDEILPESCHNPIKESKIPHFNTKEFFQEYKKQIYKEFDRLEKELF